MYHQQCMIQMYYYVSLAIVFCYSSVLQFEDEEYSMMQKLDGKLTKVYWSKSKQFMAFSSLQFEFMNDRNETLTTEFNTANDELDLEENEI